MADEIKLLRLWASPFCQRVELALKLKGLQYQLIDEDIWNKSELLLQSNPVHKKVPVLFHNGNAIAESFVIMEYIDETWKHTPLLPKHPHGRANARFWANFVDEKVFKTASIAYLGKDKAQEDSIELFSQQLKMLEAELAGKDYFGGDSIGFVDIAAFFIMHVYGVVQEVKEAELMTQEKFPVLVQWLAKLEANDLVMECLQPSEKHLAHVRARLSVLDEEAASKTKAA
ncbi:unnamed protein product [Linum tenue]|nr:unnamed protein product [Linum tenue]